MTDAPQAHRQLRARASSASLITGSWRSKFFGSQRTKQETGVSATNDQQGTSRQPTDKSITRILPTKMTEEETADVRRNMTRMGFMV